MKVALAYGERGLQVDVPDDAVVVTAIPQEGLADEAAAVTAALREPSVGRPLSRLVHPEARIAVVLPDITRPMPNRTVLPPLLAELERLGVPRDRTELLVATGTHRPATDEELRELVGDLVGRYRVRNHVATGGEHVEVGVVDGTPVLIDRGYVEADVRIVTGFVEPHFFAGFSGGYKAVCPGLAALETILEAHSPARIADPRSAWLVLDGNPVHEFVRAAASLAPPSFALDAVITSDRRLVRVFSGQLPGSHVLACDFARRTVVVEVPGRFDVVLSTNGGYPLDRNLYQAVKGMAAAERVVRDGGTILLAAECRDGVPGESEFASMLATRSPEELLDARAHPRLDLWQAQVLARILRRARVEVFSDGLSAEEIVQARLCPVDDLQAGLRHALDRHGPAARVCVLPFGPLTVADPSGPAGAAAGSPPAAILDA